MPTHQMNSNRLTVDSTSSGAELLSIRNTRGDEFLWQADPDVWARHAPHLFPIVGRLQQDTLHVNGKSYPMKQHGFARDSEFVLEEAGDNHCVYLLSDSPETQRQFPFQFELRIHYLLQGNTLTTCYDISNNGDVTLPCSVGTHPAFNWPQTGNADRSRYQICFEKNETAPLRRLDAGLLMQEKFPSPIEGNKLLLNDSMFEKDALIFTEHSSREISLRADGIDTITVQFEDFPHLGIWTKPGARFICLEPWQGHSDPSDFTGDFANKPGVVHINPGKSRKWSMSIKIGD